MNHSPYQLKTDERSSHTLITNYLIAHFQRKNISVLDLGCAGGHIGTLLPKNRFHLTGTDRDHTYKTSLPEIYRTFHSFDLNDQQWPRHTTYDVIVMADVLEHLVSPEHTLNTVQKLLRPKGILIISLPNYEFFIAKICTVLGIVPHHERGIFDRTHLHYYTRDDALTLCRQAQFNATYLMSTTVPLSLIFPILAQTFIGNMLYACATKLTNWYPKIFGYQNIFVCQKK
jgi:2-polyprenyl-3-methyl-5-hydroxy-6-metoxy-1,4-benzoquinol methylase